MAALGDVKLAAIPWERVAACMQRGWRADKFDVLLEQRLECALSHQLGSETLLHCLEFKSLPVCLLSPHKQPDMLYPAHFVISYLTLERFIFDPMLPILLNQKPSNIAVTTYSVT
jgi:hypothetical protein